MQCVRALWQDNRGQDMAEYVLILAFVALAAAAIIIGAGASVSAIWSVTNSDLSAAASVAGS
jgi:Flp pilus assembly pilin Flp